MLSFWHFPAILDTNLSIHMHAHKQVTQFHPPKFTAWLPPSQKLCHSDHQSVVFSFVAPYLIGAAILNLHPWNETIAESAEPLFSWKNCTFPDRICRACWKNRVWIISSPDYSLQAEGKNNLVNCLFNFVPCGLKIGNAMSSKMLYVTSHKA